MLGVFGIKKLAIMLNILRASVCLVYFKNMFLVSSRRLFARRNRQILQMNLTRMDKKLGGSTYILKFTRMSLLYIQHNSSAKTE